MPIFFLSISKRHGFW